MKVGGEEVGDWTWRERELWVTDAQRARQTKGGGKGDTVFKWPNQGTSPSKGELVCVCVNVCVWAGRMGRLHIDRLSPSSPAIINLPIPSSSSSPPSSPERPKLLYPSTTHSGLNKAAPRLPTHTRTHTYTHTFYNRTAQSTLDINLYLKMFNRKFRFLFCACLRRWGAGGSALKNVYLWSFAMQKTNFTSPMWLLLGFTGHV